MTDSQNNQPRNEIQIRLPQALEELKQRAHHRGLNPSLMPFNAPMLMPNFYAPGADDLYRLVLPKGAKGELMTLESGLKATTLIENGRFTGTAGLVKVGGQEQIPFWPSLIVGMMRSYEARLNAVFAQCQYLLEKQRADDKNAQLRSCKQIIESVAREHGLDDEEMRRDNRARLAGATDKSLELIYSLMPDLASASINHLRRPALLERGDMGMTDMLRHPIVEAFEVFAIGSVCRFAQSTDRSVRSVEVFERPVRDVATEIRYHFRYVFEHLNDMVNDHRNSCERVRTGNHWNCDPDFFSTAEDQLRRALQIHQAAHKQFEDAIEAKLQMFDMLKEMASRSGAVEVVISEREILISDAPAITDETSCSAPEAETSREATQEMSLPSLPKQGLAFGGITYPGHQA